MATNKMAIARRLNNKRLENDPAYDPPWFYALTSKIQSRIWLDKKRMLGLPTVNSLSNSGSNVDLKNAKCGYLTKNHKKRLKIMPLAAV